MPERILIEIATTEGPATVRAVDYDPEARLSSMVLYDQNHVPVGVDAHFDAFDRKLRKHLAGLGFATPEGGAIVEIDRPIDAGSSWQLGLALVHAASSAGLLTTSEREATRVIWVTGAIGTSGWQTRAVEAVPRKIARSHARYSAFIKRGVPVDVIVPEDNLAEAVNAAPEGVTLRTAGDLAVLIGQLFPGVGRGAAAGPGGGRRWAAVAAGVLLACGIGAAGYLLAPHLLAPGGDTAARGPGEGALARVDACRGALARFDPERVFDPARFRRLADFHRLLDSPGDALAAMAGTAGDGDRPDACADLPADAPGVGDAAIRLALLALGQERIAEARADLEALPEKGPDALFARALAAPAGARPARIAEAAEAGHRLARIADALLAAARAGGDREAGLERLRGLSRTDTGGLVDALLAALRLSASAPPAPDAGRAAWEAADAALLEGVLRVAAARARGFDIRLDQGHLAQISARAPGMLGLALADLTDAEARRFGADGTSGGALVTSVGEATPDLAPGDVILEVGRRKVSARSEAETALFAEISSSLRNGSPIGLTVMRGRDGAPRPLSLRLPRALAEVPVPAALP